jgi:negative regulator of flagellin synthesis FlgM
MKIDSSFKPTVTTVTARPPSPAVASASTQEAVSLSPLASSLQSNDQTTVNTAKIQEIKQAISQGRFKINPEAIADRLIETARDLVNTQRQREA